MKIIPWSWHEASKNRDAFALPRPYQKKRKNQTWCVCIPT